MAYDHFQVGKPDAANQTPAAAMDSTQINMAALVNDVVMGSGFVPGWAYEVVVGGGSIEEPEYYLHSLTAESKALQLIPTWTGGKITSVLARFAADYTGDVGAATWDDIGTLTISYDANDYVTGATW